MLPAAPVTTKTGLLERRLLQADTPAFGTVVADLDRAGIPQGLLDEPFGQRSGGPRGLEVDDFDEGRRPLPLQGLGETGDGTSERGPGSSIVVTVPASQTGRRDQEGAGRIQRVVKLFCSPEQKLDAPGHSLLPFLRRKLRDLAYGVQGREPIDTLDLAIAPPGLETRSERLRVGVGCHQEHLGTKPLQPPGQSLADPSPVGHDDDPRALLQFHGGLLAEVESGQQHRSRHPSRHQLCSRGGNLRGCLGFPCVGCRGYGDDAVRGLHAAARRQIGPAVVDVLDGAGQGRVVPQLQRVVPRDAPLPDRREHLRLLHRVDSQIGLHVQVQVQHLLRVSGRLRDDPQHPFLHWIVRWSGRSLRQALFRGRYLEIRNDCLLP